MIQAKFGLNWPSGFRGEDFWKSLQTDDGRIFDNNFLFFVKVTAMFGWMTAGGLQSKFWKKTTYAFFPYGLIAIDSTGF